MHFVKLGSVSTKAWRHLNVIYMHHSYRYHMVGVNSGNGQHILPHKLCLPFLPFRFHTWTTCDVMRS